MEILRVFLIIVEAVVSLLVIGLVLLQKSRSEGLGMAFGANVGESLFGSRAGNVLTKGTIILGIVFVCNTLVLGMLFTGHQQSLVEKNLGARAPATAETPLTPQAPVPAPAGASFPTTPAADTPQPTVSIPADNASAPVVNIPAPAPATTPAPANP